MSSCSVGVLVLKVKKLIKTAGAPHPPARPSPDFNTQHLSDYGQIIPRLYSEGAACRRTLTIGDFITSLLEKKKADIYSSQAAGVSLTLDSMVCSVLLVDRADRLQMMVR